MSKTPKVVPLAEKKASLIARDTNAQRIILGMGSERLAIDLFSRITRLPPHTGDQPAAVLPMNTNRTPKKKRE
jgi:hypothetical protein